MLDPGHGGTDTGARGARGVIEKDIVLFYAEATKIELERRGFRVVLTRNGDSDPSFDERAAIANAQHDAAFITLHVATTGPLNTVRTYYYQFGSATPAVQSSAVAALGVEQDASTRFAPAASSLQNRPGGMLTAAAARGPGGLLRWDDAQLPYTELSRKFAQIMQTVLASNFSGSEQLPTPTAERELRSVAGAAIAIEISSVAVSDPQKLIMLGGPLSETIGRAVAAYKAAYEATSSAGEKTGSN